MKAFDPSLASPFHMDWIAALDPTAEDDYARAVAEKAEVLLRSARFLSLHHAADNTEMEVRVWVEAACGNACVSITWEPGPGRFGFYLLDDSLRDRLACVVFHDLPCVDAEASLRQADLVLDAALRSFADAPDADVAERLARIRHAMESVRVEVAEGPRADAGVDP